MKTDNDGYLLANFMHDEFVTLREEIKESKSRKYQMVTFGVVWTPLISIVVQGLETGGIEKTGWIGLLIAILILGIILLEAGENNNISRARDYIQEQIEKRIVYDRNVLNWKGWETWLDEEIESKKGRREKERRKVDLVIHKTLFSVLFVYYLFSVICGFYWLYKSVCAIWILVVVSLFYLISTIVAIKSHRKSYKYLTSKKPFRL